MSKKESEYTAKNGVPLREGDIVLCCGDQYAIVWGRDEDDKEWILKDDRPTYDCPSLSGTARLLMSRLEDILQEQAAAIPPVQAVL